jgi:hypothetical protein
MQFSCRSVQEWHIRMMVWMMVWRDSHIFICGNNNLIAHYCENLNPKVEKITGDTAVGKIEEVLALKSYLLRLHFYRSSSVLSTAWGPRRNHYYNGRAVIFCSVALTMCIARCGTRQSSRGGVLVWVCQEAQKFRCLKFASGSHQGRKIFQGWLDTIWTQPQIRT